MSRFGSVRILSVLVLSFLLPPFALAQTSSRAWLSGSVGTALGPEDIAVSLAVAAGYKPLEHFGFELELSYVPELTVEEFDGPRILFEGNLRPQIFPPILPPRVDLTGRLLTLHSNVIADLPVGRSRVKPYLLAGGGVTNVKRDVGFPVPLELTGFRRGSLRPIIVGGSGLELSETALSLAAGGGVDFQAWDRVSVGGDVRYQHIFAAQRGHDATRAAARVTWRF